jgi:hypothetical protein
MAFTPTLLQEGILSVAQTNGLDFTGNELRRSRYGALQAASIGVNEMIPASTLTALRDASSQPTSVDVFNKIAAGSGTARKCAGTGTGTTANVSVTYNTFVEEFSISKIEHEGNRVKEQEAFNYLLNEKLKALHTRIDTAAVAALEADAQAAPNEVFGAIVGNALQFAQVDRLDFYNQFKSNMEVNDFYGGYENVHSTSQAELVRFDQAQGGANATNLQFQLGDYTHYSSNRVANIALVQSTSYIFERGTFGMVTWTNQLSRMGEEIGTDVWTTMADPFGLLGTIELKIQKGCVDNSGGLGAGAEADLVESYVLSLDVAFMTAYDSTGSDSGIYKAEILA